MAYVKRFLLICLVLFTSGCSTLSRRDKAFEQGYRLGARENIQDFSQAFLGNDFPYFYWMSPIVQSVRVPAHINNGVFIPEHNKLVLIEPGQWRKSFGYPISTSRRKTKEKPKQAEKGEPHAFNYLEFGVRDITALPESFIRTQPAGENSDTH